MLQTCKVAAVPLEAFHVLFLGPLQRAGDVRLRTRGTKPLTLCVSPAPRPQPQIKSAPGLSPSEIMENTENECLQINVNISKRICISIILFLMSRQAGVTSPLLDYYTHKTFDGYICFSLFYRSTKQSEKCCYITILSLMLVLWPWQRHLRYVTQTRFTPLTLKASARAVAPASPMLLLFRQTSLIELVT